MRVDADGPFASLPRELSLDVVAQCAPQSARLDVGVTLELPAGDFRVEVIDGAVNFQAGNACFWDVTFVVGIEGRGDLLWVTPPDPNPVQCPAANGLYRDAASAQAAAVGLAGTFSLPAPARVSIFVPDSNCRDNQGNLRVRLVQR